MATPPTKDHALVDTAITDIDQFLVYGGTAIGDALQTAVLLGRQVTDLAPTDEGGIAAPASSTTSTRSLAQAPTCGDEKSPVSILFLSDGAQTRGLLQPLEGAKLAKEACFPVYTSRSERREGVIERGPFGGFPGTPQDGQVIPVPPDPETLRADRARRPAASSRRRARRTRSSARTRTSARGSAASPVRARSRGCSSRSQPRCSCSRRRSARSSRRASRSYQTTTIVNGRSTLSSRPAGCMTYSEHAAGRRLHRRHGVSRARCRHALAPEIPTNRTSKTPVSTRRA